MGAGRGAAAPASSRAGPRALPGRVWRPLDPPPRIPDRPLRPPPAARTPLPVWIGIIFFSVSLSSLRLRCWKADPAASVSAPCLGSVPSFHRRGLTPCLMGFLSFFCLFFLPLDWEARREALRLGLSSSVPSPHRFPNPPASGPGMFRQ